MDSRFNITEKNIFVVLGMARSGTSVIARALQALNINLGQALIPADGKWNAKGFWEDSDIVYKINRGLLYASQKTEIDLINFENIADNIALKKIKKNAINILTKRLNNQMNWAFKDPRTAIFLPFWQDIFTELKLIDRYIIALRNPLASAYSYHRVSGIDVEVGLILWLIHLVAAIDHTRQKKCVVVNYDLLLKHPKDQLERIKNNLLINHWDDEEINSFSKNFLDDNLKHFEYTLADLVSHRATAVVPLCAKVYELLMKTATDQIHLNSEDFSFSWCKIKNEFFHLYPIYCYINNLLKKNKYQEKIIYRIHQSLVWKLSFPFRVINEIFIDIKLKIRKRKKLKRFYE